MAKRVPVREPAQSPVEPSHGGGYVCIIFNNDHNTMDEVIEILMVATGCCFDEAYCEMWEAHHYGQAACHFGAEQECRDVARIVSSIGLKTDVREEWG